MNGKYILVSVHHTIFSIDNKGTIGGSVGREKKSPMSMKTIIMQSSEILTVKTIW